MAMPPSKFTIVEHTIQCQAIREYQHAVQPGTPALQLAVKQYIPIDNPNPGPDDVTIIAGHANGIPKECYEPLWEDLLSLTTVKVKAIWVADCVNQGASSILNEDSLGDDTNWFDHSRDLLYMVNHFRDQIKPPVVGIPHSFSCSQFVHLSIMHPKLFHSLIFLEPMMQIERPGKAGGWSPALWSSTRPDLWPSRAQAEKDIRENPFWRRWDARAFNKYIEYGLRSCPTALYPNSSPGAVTLTTTRAQEAWSYLRFNAAPMGDRNHADIERFVNADLARVPKDGDLNNPEYVFVAPWACIAFEYLAYVRPTVLYVFGEKSHINIPARRQDKLGRTGTGLGGNGGLENGRVRQETLSGGSHMVPLEKVRDTARLIASWLDSQMEVYRAEMDFWKRQYDSQKSERNGAAMSALWMNFVKQRADVKRAAKPKI